MDAIGSTRVSEFMNTYVNSSYLEPSSDPQHRAALEQSLVEFRLLTSDFAQVRSMLDEIGSHRAFIHWTTARIQEAEQRGEDTYLLKWDRGFAGARIRDLEGRVLALLGPSLEIRLADSRESFRLRYLDSGALGKAPGWAGDDPAVQDALDGMLISDSAQAVVNQYLHAIGSLQRDSAALERSLASGGALALSPRRRPYEMVLSGWRQDLADRIQTVMGILEGTVDASQVDPVPWSLRTDLTAAARPPVSAAERRAYQLGEDSAWLSTLGTQARAVEGALALLAPHSGTGATRTRAAEELREQSQRRYDLVQQQRALVACIQAVLTRLELMRTATAPVDGAVAVDLEVVHARRKLDSLTRAHPVDTRPLPPPDRADADVYKAALPYFQSEQTLVIQAHQSLAGKIEHLTAMLEVPKGFKPSDEQRGELGLLWSQRAELLSQQQSLSQELAALKALIDPMARAMKRGEALDAGSNLERENAWQAAKLARQEGEAARQGALTTPLPEFVAWQLSARNSRSRAPTVLSNYLLSEAANAAVQAQLAADRKTAGSLRSVIRAHEAAMEAVQTQLALITRSGASAAQRADLPAVQARLGALQALRTSEMNRLLLVEQMVKDNGALRTSNSAGNIAQRQQALALTQVTMQAAWLDQVRKERQLAQADRTLAERGLAKLQDTAGASNTQLLEARKLLDYREKAVAYAEARVVATEVEQSVRNQPVSMEAARQALQSTRDAMQAAYFDLVQLRGIFRRDALSRELNAAQARNRPMDERLRLQEAMVAAQVAWPLGLAPFPVTPAEKAAAVLARHGEDLPE